MAGVSFHYRQPLLVLDAVGPLWAENKLCHDNTAWWDSKSWNSEKPSTAAPRSLRVKRMNPRSSLRDWPNPGQKCVVDSGKANCRQENMKRYSCLFTLCISTAMLVLKKVCNAKHFNFLLDADSTRAIQTHFSPKNSPRLLSMHLVPAVAG